MDPYQEVLQDLLRNLTNFHGMGFEPLARQIQGGTPEQRQAAINRMVQYVAHFGQFIRNYQQKLMEAHQKAKVAAAEEELISLADYLDQNGFHALANKVDDVIQISAEFRKSADAQLEQAFRMLSDAHSTMQRDLVTHSDDLDMLKKAVRETLYGRFAKGLATLGQYVGMSADDKMAAARNSLIILSDNLDQNGFHALADKTDEVLGLIKTAEEHGFVPYGYVPRMRKTEQEVVAQDQLIQPMREGSLSTRYCPDHRGVQAIRIGENTYQCPLDGKVYDYQSGYVNYEGQRVPGGSVAAQTPQTSNYGGIPMRIYDSRSDVLNKMI